MGEIIDRHTVETADDMMGIVTCACGDVGDSVEHPWHVAGELSAAGYGKLPDDSILNRMEIITEKGRDLISYTQPSGIRTDRQDDGRTLKVFITQGDS